MKPLFILARSRRAVETLEAELNDFGRKIGQSYDDAIGYGDLIFWPVRSVSGAHRTGTHHPNEFWEVHREALESAPLSEIVIGEFGKSVFSAAESEHVDSFQDREYLYGSEAAPQDDDENADGDFYDDRLFWTVDTQEWFDYIEQAEDTRSFGRKLLVLIGRSPEKRFLDGRIGEKLRGRLGKRARVVFNSNHEDVVVFAFDHHTSPGDLFEQIKGLIPPRLILDFLIVDIGLKYCTGSEPLSVFAEWAELPRGGNPRGPTPPQGGKSTPRTVIVEKARRHRVRTGRPDATNGRMAEGTSRSVTSNEGMHGSPDLRESE